MYMIKSCPKSLENAGVCGICGSVRFIDRLNRHFQTTT